MVDWSNVTIADICHNEGKYSHEFDLASSTGRGRSKRLTCRVTIVLDEKTRAALTHVTYTVYDMSQPENHRITMIAGELQSALDAYNKIT